MKRILVFVCLIVVAAVCCACGGENKGKNETVDYKGNTYEKITLPKGYSYETAGIGKRIVIEGEFLMDMDYDHYMLKTSINRDGYGGVVTVGDDVVNICYPREYDLKAGDRITVYGIVTDGGTDQDEHPEDPLDLVDYVDAEYVEIMKE